MVETDGGAGAPGESADKMRERGSGSRVRLWLLMSANRWVMTGVLLAATFLAILAVAWLDPGPFRSALSRRDPVETLFQAMITAIITGVTLVVTINQIVLSQELGPLGDQQSRMEGAMDVRERVEDHIDDPVSPDEPAAFLQSLVVAARDRARTISDAAASMDGDRADEVQTFAHDVIRNASDVVRDFDSAEFGTFDALSAALDFNYSAKIYEARRIRATAGDALPDAADDALEELVETLGLFGAGREHIKTLYFQWELINLSRAMLYAAVPAFVTAATMILFFDDPASVPGETLGVANVVLLVAAATVVTVAPFMLLVSYVLRIATVAKRTLAIGPFVLRKTGEDSDRER